MHEKFDPCDLGSVARFLEIDRESRNARLADAHAEVRRRMQRAKSMEDGINPYDLDQMAHIFEPLNALHRRHF